jgi:hypothetical protein
MQIVSFERGDGILNLAERVATVLQPIGTQNRKNISDGWRMGSCSRAMKLYSTGISYPQLHLCDKEILPEICLQTIRSSNCHGELRNRVVRERIV